MAFTRARGVHGRNDLRSQTVLHRIMLSAKQHKLFPLGCRSRATVNGLSFASHCAFRDATQTVSMWLPLSCYS
jgi:hypothetical protein